MSINPYEVSQQVEIEPQWKDVVDFDGVVNEEHFRRLLPRSPLRLFAVLALLLVGVASPILVASFILSTFIAPDALAATCCAVMLIFVVAATYFCIQMSSTRLRARSILKKFPDLIGPMSGSFSESGLILNDGKSTHWFPWVLVSRMVISKDGVRVLLGTDPRRFLALSAEFFEPFYPSNLAQLKERFQVKEITFEQLKSDSARVFGSELGSRSFYEGWYQTKVPISTWIEVLLAPASACVFTLMFAFQGQNNWLGVAIGVFCILMSLPSLKRIWQFVRGRNTVSAAFWGWFDQKRLIHGTGTHWVQITRSEFSTAAWDEEKIVMTLPSGSQFVLLRSCFADKEYFDRVRSEIGRTASV